MQFIQRCDSSELPRTRAAMCLFRAVRWGVNATVVWVGLLVSVALLAGFAHARGIESAVASKSLTISENFSVAEVVEHPWVVRSRLVELDLAMLRLAALAPADRPRIDLALFDDTRVTIEVKQAEFRTPDRFTFSGVVPRAIGSEVIISVCVDAVYGVITLPAIGTFEIRFEGDGIHRVEHLDTDLMPGCGVRANQLVAAPEARAHRREDAMDGSPLSNDVTVVDVLVVYTPAARNAAGGTNGMLALVDTAMWQTNQSLANSQTLMVMELFDAREVGYVENNNIFIDLQRLTNPNSGHMDEVHHWRDEGCGADLVALLSHNPNYNYCGVAWLPDEPIANNPDYWANYAFSVTWTACVTNYTFAHELGHNLGCHHAHGDSSGSGSWPYSHGHRFFGDSGTQWRTVMAYSPGIRIMHFSNPDVFHDGAPTGVPPGGKGQAHNTLTIDDNRVAISQYRTCQLPPPPNPPHPVIANISCEGVLITWPDGTAPPEGVTWYWQGTSCGHSTQFGSGSDYLATESGTYYLRARNDTGEWSEGCGFVEVVQNVPNPPDPVVVETLCESAIVSWPPDAAPPDGVTWYWQSGQCGEDTTLGSEPTLHVTEQGAYLLRAKSNQSGCWSAQCGSREVSFDSGYWHNEMGQPGMNSPVRALTVWNGDLIAGGGFTTAGGQTVNRIARWDGSEWHPFTSGGQIGVKEWVAVLTVWNGDLVAGGSFTTAGGQTVNRIARWDGSAWHPFTAGGQIGVNNGVGALTVWNGDLIAGGTFTTAGGQTVNRIARWDGSQWHPFESGGQIGVNDWVFALTVWNGDLIAGGLFTTAGGQTVNFIARWDGSAWHPFTSGGQIGVGMGTFVWPLTAWNGDLIAGGDFTTAGGQTVNRIARWDGSAWHPFTSGGQIGVSDRVFALSGWNEHLIAGGQFITAGGQTANHIARWDGCPDDDCDLADLNCDGIVDGADLGLLLANWGLCDDCNDCIADLNGDCQVDGADLGILLANWG